MITWKCPGLVFVGMLFALQCFGQHQPAKSLKATTATAAELDGCMADQVRKELIELLPGVSNSLHATEWLVRNRPLETPNARSSTLVIPVVVHVLHDNGPENIPSSQVQNAISLLNASFENVVPYTQAGGAATGIQFCLARRDPQGNPSDGINYQQTSLTTYTRETQDSQVKSLSQWPSDRYLNIWVVREILSQNQNNNVSAYATFPFLHGDVRDGIAIEAAFFGSSPRANKVLTHEAGHYLGLYHTFEGGCSNNDCQAEGDRVCDTPPDGSTATTLVPINTCTTDGDDSSPANPFRAVSLGGLGEQFDPIDNFMDYGRLDVLARFTQGQRIRMRQHLLLPRQSLLGTNACESPCTSFITAAFTPSNNTVVIGDSVAFANQSIGATQFEWSVNGTVISNSNSASYTFNQTGVYTVQLVAGNGQSGCESITSQNILVRCDARADFSSSSTSVFAGGTATFTSTSQNASQILWLLDGQPAGAQSVLSQTFLQPGVHTVQLLAYSANCVDSSSIAYIEVGSCGRPAHTMNWIFGDSTSMGFQNGTGTPTGPSSISTFEGCTAYSDNSGSLLFYSNGNTVWNRNHLPIGNGTGLMGHKSASQGVISVPLPGSPMKHLLFTVDALETGFFSGLRYSTVDMGLLNGVGAIPPTQKNIPLAPVSSEMLTAVQHDNGEDYWLLSHQAFSPNFKAFQITSSGVNSNPVVSAIGPNLDLPTGYMKVSPNRRKIAMSYNRQAGRALAIADFDPATGIVSNLFQIPVGATQQVYGVEFSEDGSKVYFTTLYDLYQVDLSLGNQAAIVASRINLYSTAALRLMGLQRGLDGKIYVAGGMFDKIHRIENPNLAGPACNFQWEAIGLNDRRSMWGLPNFMNGLPPGIEKVDLEGTNEVCQGDQLVWFRARKSSLLDQITWTAPGASIAQTSLDTLAGIVFDQAGLREVMVERSSQCGLTRDTILVNVKAAPVSQLGNDTTTCPGATVPLVACSTGCDVLWSTGSTAPGIFATPPARLSVRIENSTGCVTNDTIALDTLALLPMNIDLGQDTSVCDGGVVLLEANPGPHRQYLWQDGSQQRFHTATGPGIYVVQVSDVCGGFGQDSLEIIDSSPNILELGPDQPICPGDTLQLTPGADFLYTEWQDGSTGEYLYATTPGTYHLTATTYGGCIVRDTIELTACTVGMPDGQALSHLTVYPNPNAGAFQLRLAGVEMESHLETVIYDGLGRLVFHEKTSGYQLSKGMPIDLQDISSGIYHLEIRSPEATWHRSIKVNTH